MHIYHSYPLIRQDMFFYFDFPEALFFLFVGFCQKYSNVTSSFELRNLPSSLIGPSGNASKEPMSAMCKTNTLNAVLSLWPLLGLC